MSGLLALAIRLGVPQRFAGAAVAVVLFLLALAALELGKCAYDKSVIDNHEAKVERRAAPATDKAATERANDTIATAKHEQELHDVIQAQPDQPSSPTSRALACKRLSDAGKHPPACR
jgi:hypothetical protein